MNSGIHFRPRRLHGYTHRVLRNQWLRNWSPTGHDQGYGIDDDDDDIVVDVKVGGCYCVVAVCVYVLGGPPYPDNWQDERCSHDFGLNSSIKVIEHVQGEYGLTVMLENIRYGFLRRCLSGHCSCQL